MLLGAADLMVLSESQESTHTGCDRAIRNNVDWTPLKGLGRQTGKLLTPGDVVVQCHIRFGDLAEELHDLYLLCLQQPRIDF